MGARVYWRQLHFYDFFHSSHERRLSSQSECGWKSRKHEFWRFFIGETVKRFTQNHSTGWGKANNMLRTTTTTNYRTWRKMINHMWSFVSLSLDFFISIDDACKKITIIWNRRIGSQREMVAKGLRKQQLNNSSRVNVSQQEKRKKFPHSSETTKSTLITKLFRLAGVYRD